jgi:hypothetical protein
MRRSGLCAVSRFPSMLSQVPKGEAPGAPIVRGGNHFASLAPGPPADQGVCLFAAGGGLG